ncbi:hypothetical protein N0V91_000465 [Didymella pomorum]|uniref:Uncharacterized protein n=1 Tax=Didymella pomorum TaxID=749634 RepID=A0A9W8ZP15_9PLEO|nr:hypothetical protein N0V91_000465 [Didymella pomorum]
MSRTHALAPATYSANSYSDDGKLERRPFRPNRTGLQQRLDDRDAVIDAVAAKAAAGKMTDADGLRALSCEVLDALMERRDLRARIWQQMTRIEEAELRKELEKKQQQQNKLQKEKKPQIEQ